MEHRHENNLELPSVAAANDSDSSVSDVESDDGSENDEPIHLNNRSFLQLSRNDPALTHIHMEEDGFATLGASHVVGHLIGNGTHLKSLLISGYGRDEESEQSNKNLCALLEGVALSSSIKYFYFDSCVIRSNAIASLSLLGGFSPFFRNIRIFAINDCSVETDSAVSLASVLRQSNSLERVCFGSRNISPFNIGRLIQATGSHHNLKVLSLNRSNMGWEAVHQLGNSIQNPLSTIEEIILCDCLLDDSCMVQLAKSLAKKKRLKLLDLENNNRITNTGWQAVFGLLHNDSFVLKELAVNDNSIDDESAVFLANKLGNNTTLSDLDLSNNRLVTEEGWRTFSAILQSPKSALEYLDIDHTTIGSRFSLDFGAALLGNGTLKGLTLKGIHPFGQAGCQTLAAYLQHPTCVLKELDLNGSDVDDEGGRTIANALTVNKTLTILSFADIYAITIQLARDFVEVLCKRSSIADTYASNHTLLRIEGTPHRDPQLRFLLRQNRSSKEETVRKKIIWIHFIDEKNNITNLQKFHHMGLSTLPHAMKWMGTNTLGLTLLHKVLTSMPSLFGPGRRAITKKRKRVWRSSDYGTKPLLLLMKFYSGL